MSLRTLTRLGALPLALGAVVLGVAAPASAHVTISASTTAAGAFAVLTLSVPHGCDGSATTEIAIQIPEEVNAVTPTRNALWEVDKQVEDVKKQFREVQEHFVEQREYIEFAYGRLDSRMTEGFSGLDRQMTAGLDRLDRRMTEGLSRLEGKLDQFIDVQLRPKATTRRRSPSKRRR